MKIKFVLNNLQTGETKNYKTLQDIAEDLNIEYHKVWELSKAEDKQFLHPFLKDLSKKYKISKYTQPLAT